MVLEEMKTYYLLIQGIVQGVGFRPFIKNLADTYSLKGSVINSSIGVEIYFNATDQQADIFISAIRDKQPIVATIKSIDKQIVDTIEFDSFEILDTIDTLNNINIGGLTLIAPDLAVCADCISDILDKDNRRYLYPFTNCTNCGARYSIIDSIPYDRKNSSMRDFELCEECKTEYLDSSDRRFHAEANACHKCGPKITLYYADKVITDNNEALRLIGKSIDNAKIVAVKGLGGFHLILSAKSDEAIKRLRDLKFRQTKPFAVMAKDIEAIEKYIKLSDDDKRILTSKEAPILIIDQRIDILSRYISPHQQNIGIMIAYTPLHRLLFEFMDTEFIIATSANISDEPIVKDIFEAKEKLSRFTDIFLDHDREIYTRLDDSVIMRSGSGYTFIRRSRSYAPYPIEIDKVIDKDIFAAGADLKSTLAFYKNGYIFLSQYIGDLNNISTSEYYNETYKKLSTAFNINPTVAVRDYHPNFTSSIYAESLGIDIFKVQHHLAHFLSVLAEHNYHDDAIGIVLDGFGLGIDDTAWGGEFFVKQSNSVSREFRLKQYIQPSMDASTRSPYMMLISYLTSMGMLGRAEKILKSRLRLSDKEIKLVEAISKSGINSILTSSAGRLFESVGSLLIGERDNEYEGSLAIRLEAIIDNEEKGYYEFNIEDNELDFVTTFEQILSDLESNVSVPIISARFHNGFSRAISEVAVKLSKRYNIKVITVSGGVFQNRIILDRVIECLEGSGLVVMRNEQLPTNDASIAVGQIYAYLYDIKLRK